MDLSEELPEVARSALMDLEARGRKQGQPFFISPTGLPDVVVNSFFTSRRMRSRSPLTWKKYSHSLGLWLNFLEAIGQDWRHATEDDAECFK